MIMRERNACWTAKPALGGIPGLEDQSMKKVALSMALAASLSACATNPYGYNDPYYGNNTNNEQARRAATGADGVIERGWPSNVNESE